LGYGSSFGFDKWNFVLYNRDFLLTNFGGI